MPQVIEGNPREIQDHLKGLGGNVRLTLIVNADGDLHETRNNIHHTPEERARALDEVAAMNRDLPALPPEAFRRENLYEDRL